MKEVFEYLSRGGVVMIPIALGSVVALAIFLERMWALQKSRIIPGGLVERVVKLVNDGDFGTARDECLRSNSPMGRVMLAGVEAKGADREAIKGLFEEVGKQEISRLERNIEAMGTTASIEPLLGLLGTVTGMIQVFQKVVVTSRSGAVDPGQLANGIWQALITTAAGLSVAIIAFMGYRYLLSRTVRHSLAMEEGALRLVGSLAPLGGGTDGAKDSEAS